MLTVRDIMTRRPVLEAVQLMLDKGIHRVLVVAGPGRLGIVSATDVLRTLVDGRFVESAARASTREQRDNEEGDEASAESADDVVGYASYSP